jgi:hypothetical protein
MEQNILKDQKREIWLIKQENRFVAYHYAVDSSDFIG